MKVSKFTMLAMATILFASIASATPVNAVCTPNPATYGPGSTGGTETCTMAALPVGATLTGVRFGYSLDAQWDFLNTTGGAATLSFTLFGSTVGSSNLTEAAGTGVLVPSGTAFACNATCTAAVTNGTTFLVQDVVVNTGTAAALQGTTFSKAFGFDYTQPTGTPEPASFAMIGAGLLALGAFARRRSA